MYILYLIAGALVGVAVFFLLCDIFKVPKYKTSKALAGVQKQLKVGDGRINTSLEEVASWLAKRIRLSELKRANLASDLATARMDITPEMFVANTLVKSGIVALLAIPMFPMWKLGGFLFLALAVVNYFDIMSQLRRKIRAHRKSIEYELPRLVFTIEKVLKHNRNIIQMLESYRDIAGPDMKREIEITLADMNSGNQETAITRLEIRVGSSMMSDVCRGLISILHGDDTRAYWSTLGMKFSEHQRNLLKAEAAKIPKKVNRNAMVLMYCFMLMWVGVLVVQVIESLSEMF